MKTFSLEFQGYWLQSNLNTLPHKSGIYLVHRCVHKVQVNKVVLKELLYIGKAQNVNDRISNHEKHPLFQKSLLYGEQICVAFAPVSITDLDRVENALIFTQKPPLNEVLKDSFNHPPTTVILSGRYGLIEPGIWTTQDDKEIIIETE